MGIQSETALAQAYELIETGNPGKAKVLLEDALTADLDNTDLVFTVHCCSFWLDTFENLEQLDFFEQGESLVNQWKRFKLLVSREKSPLERTVYAFRKGVFSRALESYRGIIDDSGTDNKAEIYRKTGLCYKKLGAYETALGCLTEANNLSQGNAPVLAEMADCYALCGEDKRAKVLFREAFFVDPLKVDLAFLDSPLIKLLVEQVQAKGYTGQVLQEWIPVYGVLLGVFTVKRELRSQEAGKLKQEIYARENELKDPGNDSTIITPRLLNLYFWLIDHYVNIKESVSKINEVLIKIKILDASVYKLYVK
jgi:tetratricopeptide (TPR) repeat protein